MSEISKDYEKHVLPLMDALKDVSETMPKSDERDAALSEIATTYVEIGRLEAARAIESTLKRHSPASVNVRLAMVASLASHGDFDDAVKEAYQVGGNTRRPKGKDLGLENLAVGAAVYGNVMVPMETLPKLPFERQQFAAARVAQVFMGTRNLTGGLMVAEGYLNDAQTAELMLETGHVDASLRLAKKNDMKGGYWVNAAMAFQYEDLGKAFELLDGIEPSLYVRALIDIGMNRKNKGLNFHPCVLLADKFMPDAGVEISYMENLIELRAAAGIDHEKLLHNYDKFVSENAPEHERRAIIAGAYMKCGKIAEAFELLEGFGKKEIDASLEKMIELVEWLREHGEREHALRLTHLLPGGHAELQRAIIGAHLAVGGRLEQARGIAIELPSGFCRYTVQAHIAGKIAEDGNPNDAIHELAGIRNPLHKVEAMAKAASVVGQNKKALPLFDQALKGASRIRPDILAVSSFADIARRQSESGFSVLNVWNGVMPVLKRVKSGREATKKMYGDVGTLLTTVKQEVARTLTLATLTE